MKQLMLTKKAIRGFTEEGAFELDFEVGPRFSLAKGTREQSAEMRRCIAYSQSSPAFGVLSTLTSY